MVGLIAYWTTISYDRDVLLKLAAAIYARYELARSLSSVVAEFQSANEGFDELVHLFLTQMWQTLYLLSERDWDDVGAAGRLEIWMEVYEVYYASRRFVVPALFNDSFKKKSWNVFANIPFLCSDIGRLLTPVSFVKHSCGWKDSD